MKDSMNTIHPTTPSVATVTDNTPVVSSVVDLQGYSALTFLIATGILADADATFTVLVEEGDAADLSDAAPVADADLLGTEVLAGLTFADDNAARKIGYVGNKRYARCTVTPAGNTGSAPLAILPVLGRPWVAPTSNPPA